MIGLMRISTRVAILPMILSVALNAQVAKAADAVDFPDEELSAESVLPVFDDPSTVKNRTVTTARRIELGVLFGQSMLEPFFNPFFLGASAAYHFNEDHGMNLLAQFHLPGTSSNAEQLNPIPNTSINANLQYAPAPKYLLLGNYQYTGFYGKISLTKETVMNLSVLGTAGAGFIGIGDALKPAFGAGIGQKFYMGQSFALRVDLRFLMYLGPDILSRSLQYATETQPASSFSDKLNFSTMLSVGGVFLLPEI